MYVTITWKTMAELMLVHSLKGMSVQSTKSVIDLTIDVQTWDSCSQKQVAGSHTFSFEFNEENSTSTSLGDESYSLPETM